MVDVKEIRRLFIADSELADIKEEYARWQRRKAGTENGDPANCADFCAAYANDLVRAIEAMETLNEHQ